MGDFVQHSIERLTSTHDRGEFDCGTKWLNDYLRLHALRNDSLGYGRTYVAVPQGSLIVDGFFTISMSSVVFENLPDELSRKSPRYPMPVALLGCLAVRMQLQGKGLGGLLLIDAFRRIVAAADLVAARAMEVRAIDSAARQWYLRRGFLAFKDHPDHLYLPMDTIRRVVAEADR